MKSGTGAEYAYGKIYKASIGGSFSAVGTEQRTVETAAYQTYDEDITIAIGDTLAVFVKGPAFIGEFSLMISETPGVLSVLGD